MKGLSRKSFTEAAKSSWQPAFNLPGDSQAQSPRLGPGHSTYLEATQSNVCDWFKFFLLDSGAKKFAGLESGGKPLIFT